VKESGGSRMILQIRSAAKGGKYPGGGQGTGAQSWIRVEAISDALDTAASLSVPHQTWLWSTGRWR
jgi:hypothetical protein